MTSNEVIFCIAENGDFHVNAEPNIVRSGGDGLDVRVGYGIL